MRHPRPAPSHAPTIQRRPEPAAADLAPAPPLGAMRTAIFPVEPGAGLLVTVEGGKPVAVETRPSAAAPWWNGIARAWMVAGPDGAPVRLDPQPAVTIVPLTVTGVFEKDGAGKWSPVPPAVKVSA